MAYMDQFKEKPDFNMAVLFLERLNDLWKQADLAKNNRNMISWYSCLDTIYCNVKFKIDEAGHEEEEKILDEHFQKAINFLSPDSATSREQTKQIEQLAVTQTEKVLREVHMKLHTLLYKYGLIFPKKQEEKSFEELLAEGMGE